MKGRRARRNGVGVPKRVPDDVLQTVIDRDGGRCRVCHELCHGDPPHHILRKSRWPELAHNPDNLITICLPCHMRHETAFKRIPFSVLPQAALELAERVGPNAVHHISVTYGTVEGDATWRSIRY